jgi:hypothetical protein
MARDPNDEQIHLRIPRQAKQELQRRADRFGGQHTQLARKYILDALERTAEPEPA